MISVKVNVESGYMPKSRSVINFAYVRSIVDELLFDHKQFCELHKSLKAVRSSLLMRKKRQFKKSLISDVEHYEAVMPFKQYCSGLGTIISRL